MVMRINPSRNSQHIAVIQLQEPNITELRDAFTSELQFARQNPKASSEKWIPMPENPLFISTVILV